MASINNMIENIESINNMASIVRNMTSALGNEKTSQDGDIHLDKINTEIMILI